MEKIKQQFGVITVDGQERKYCHFFVEVGEGDGISKITLCDQFKLFAESFWIYLQGKEEAKINKSLLEPDGNVDFDDSFLRKGWMR